MGDAGLNLGQWTLNDPLLSHPTYNSEDEEHDNKLTKAIMMTVGDYVVDKTYGGLSFFTKEPFSKPAEFFE